MIALLTGGTGYIGRYVALACLAAGWEVHLLTRKTSVIHPSIDGHVTRHDHDGGFDGLRAILESVSPHCVLHLASAPVKAHDPAQVESLLLGNVTFPTLLIEAMRVTGVRNLVNTGTFWQHYRQSSYWPVDFYAATKQAFEDILRHYTDMHGMSVVTLKLFDSYGPDDHRRKILNILLDAARQETELALSPGDQVLDLTHVEDIGQAFVEAADILDTAEAGTNQAYYVSGERMPLKSLVGLIRDRSRTGLRVELGARPYREREIMDPIEPGVDLLPNWKPRRRVSDMIDLLMKAD